MNASVSGLSLVSKLTGIFECDPLSSEDDFEDYSMVRRKTRSFRESMTTEERNVEGSNDRTAKKVKRSEMSVEDRENEKKKTLAMVKTLRSSQPTEENEVVRDRDL
ncbi:unnamed protein product [Lepeophtheirus salmonis]|uniref:(salmon louse) hypothetical protein n=1 Tax=Lepeophtheirus salmonis TaxID=72036 RepID=A0A7R8CLV5_LEPSM|nr:unnamed protein product [Lepeophtheirus salmonis]CAF2816224.1 unnamed protein product [Lepeophtheirus salmonis]